MCSVINGGSYYQPHLVTEIRDSSGSTVKKIDPILMKQTVSSEISADIRSYMEASVQEGTSRTSKVRDTVQVVRPVQQKNFREATANIWFLLLHLHR